MIIFIAGGRLGNQIFQYAFINSIRKRGEKVFVSGFEELKDIFELDELIIISRKKRYFRGIIFRIFYPILDILVSIRIITKIEVIYDNPTGHEESSPKRESTTYSVKLGILKTIRFIKQGYFQSEYFFHRSAIEKLIIKSKYLNEAQKFFYDIPLDTYNIFVHIRRGDYHNLKIFGNGTLLPISYYKNCIDYFIKNTSNSFFIFLSDDPEFVEMEFAWLKNKKLSVNNPPGIDFAIITKCKSGVLSTSSFGWWAAYLIKEKGTIFAPKYWLGFNSKIEFPKGGFPSFAKDVEI
ncbi:MAG: alpha-1,2-fucosyltransferase [Ignavibacteria bacterium]|nr:alpha-1,2-fucosyltransferase [Ignavibacteria bacterium]